MPNGTFRAWATTTTCKPGHWTKLACSIGMGMPSHGCLMGSMSRDGQSISCRLVPVEVSVDWQDVIAKPRSRVIIVKTANKGRTPLLFLRQRWLALASDAHSLACCLSSSSPHSSTPSTRYRSCGGIVCPISQSMRKDISQSEDDEGLLQDVKESALFLNEPRIRMSRDVTQSRTVLVTGAAGFIGFHTALRLAREQNTRLICFDVVNDYYDVNLKHARLAELLKHKSIDFIQGGEWS